MLHTAITDRPNEPSMASDASPPDISRGSLRPASVFTRNPRRGRSGIQINTALTFQFPERVGVEAFRVPEQRDDDGQAHRGFGGGNRNDKKDDDLAVR